MSRERKRARGSSRDYGRFMRNVLAVVGVLALLVIAGASVLSYVEERDQTRSAARVECLTEAATAFVPGAERDTSYPGFSDDDSMWDSDEWADAVTSLDALVNSAQRRGREAERCD